MSKTNKNRHNASKRNEKKRKREKANKKARNRRRNSAPAMSLSRDNYRTVSDDITEKYQNEDYTDYSDLMGVWDSLVSSSAESIAMQANNYAILSSVVARTPSIRRNQLEEYSTWHKLFSPFETKTVQLTGFITEVEFGVTDSHVDIITEKLMDAEEGTTITRNDLDEMRANTACRFMLSCPKIYNPKTNRCEDFEDSHIWLFANHLQQCYPLDKTVYLGDRVMIVAEIAKYDKRTPTGLTKKWGLTNWLISDSMQEYIYQNRIQRTPASIKRLVPLFDISGAMHEDDGREVVGCDVVVDKKSYKKGVKELKKVFEEHRGDFLLPIDRQKKTGKQPPEEK